MKLLTTPEVAARLGVTVARVQQLIWDGRLPAEKIGRDYVVREEDLTHVADRKPGRPGGAARKVQKRPRSKKKRENS